MSHGVSGEICAVRRDGDVVHAVCDRERRVRETPVGHGRPLTDRLSVEPYRRSVRCRGDNCNRVQKVLSNLHTRTWS